MIANRGEIAVRIIRACRNLGIRSVAVYSKEDAKSLHVQLADQRICIGEGPARNSYLNMDRIIAAAENMGADAIHPGFGFLSENSEFVRKCKENGITFIGPDADVIDKMGNKSHARKTMMDAGVKLRKPVSGIAMGLISDSETGKWAVLSDILGDEDHLGDMDFKVTGTKDGITATQMDIKVDGLSYEVLAAALEQARKGRMHILGKLTECIAEPREDYKPCVPRIVQIVIPQDMIGPVIGPGGKVIQDIQKTTNTTITITEVDNKGIVDIFGIDKEALDGALARIKAIVAIPEVGETYHGKVRSIVAFGAFVEIMPGKDALLHISEIDYKRFETMEETGLKEGDEIDVKLIGVDPKTNKLKLSRKALLPKPEGYVERERRPRPERGERGERRDRGERRERHEHKEE